ncbi:putative heterokaryon incompatibility protein [Rosellinia necatrix]|uniref:Putative heterokaryon incompatibility protein n=1 Tax=Rosellinia necatrix TaxID=77044 RepID=A0A1S8ABJ5_ROSNE|nr:putative heterokaryon incompatibility protein [Rosellinia necatrix]
MTWPPFTWKAPKFKYQSLRSKPRTFRVIKLLPPTRSFLPPFKQILNIKIREVSLDEGAGQYDTLSYCWGTGAADRPVAVLQSGDDRSSGGYQTIHISASLEAALLSLSREGDGEARRHIFADQISINQSDNAEKVEQVRLMGEIYARSARVVVWLGEDTAETGLFFDFSTRLSSEGILSRAMGPNVGHYMNVFDAIMNSSLELETEAEKEDRNDILDLIARYGPQFPLTGLADILRRSWANRLWTVQEGCLPPKVVFRSGQNSLCYDCVRGSLLFHSVWTTYWMRMRKGSVSKEDIRARSRIYDLTQSFHRINRERKAIHVTRGRRRCLYDVVVRYNVNENRPKIGATKAEDRIYALS